MEDENFARNMSKAEVEDITGGRIDDDEDEEPIKEEVDCTQDDVKVQRTIRTDKSVQRSSCGKDVAEDMSTIVDEVKDTFNYVV